MRKEELLRQVGAPAVYFDGRTQLVDDAERVAAHVDREVMVAGAGSRDRADDLVVGEQQYLARLTLQVIVDRDAIERGNVLEVAARRVAPGIDKGERLGSLCLIYATGFRAAGAWT